MIGDKRYTEALDVVWVRPDGVVGERCSNCEAERETDGGVTTSENADMSSDKPG